MSTHLSAAELYPSRGGQPTYTLLDVRAPAEVLRGALPFAVHLPILSDEERHKVGLRYKEAGQDAAIRLGYALTETAMPARVAAWRQVTAAGATAVTCWRGGLRSQLACEFIGDRAVPRVAGGYKALRGYLLGQFEPALSRYQTLVVAGLTGSGKTDLLRAIAGAPACRVLDLERHANHRGSAFGSLGVQPAQASFEHALALELLLGCEPRLLVEDESRTLGERTLPEALYKAVQQSPVVIVEAGQGARARRIHRDYVVTLSEHLGGRRAAADVLQGRVARLRQRLGGEVTDRALASLQRAATSDTLWRDAAAHGWIATLLEHYYDPLYRRALGKLERPVLFRGDLEACRAWLTDLSD